MEFIINGHILHPRERERMGEAEETRWIESEKERRLYNVCTLILQVNDDVGDPQAPRMSYIHRNCRFADAELSPAFIFFPHFVSPSRLVAVVVRYISSLCSCMLWHSTAVNKGMQHTSQAPDVPVRLSVLLAPLLLDRADEARPEIRCYIAFAFAYLILCALGRYFLHWTLYKL